MIQIDGVPGFGVVRHYERRGLYSPDEILCHVGHDTVEFDGDPIRMNSLRYRLFKTNLVCVQCMLTGLFFAKERLWPTSRGFHFNLYGLNLHGHEVMLTRDHIVPRSCGGEDVLANLQTLCSPCNSKKKDRLPTETNEEYSQRQRALKEKSNVGRKAFVPYVPTLDE